MRDRKQDARDRKKRKKKGDDMIVHGSRFREIIKHVTNKLRKPLPLRGLWVARQL